MLFMLHTNTYTDTHVLCEWENLCFRKGTKLTFYNEYSSRSRDNEWTVHFMECFWKIVYVNAFFRLFFVIVQWDDGIFQYFFFVIWCASTSTASNTQYVFFSFSYNIHFLRIHIFMLILILLLGCGKRMKWRKKK